jgi:hypothetical protein
MMEDELVHVIVGRVVVEDEVGKVLWWEMNLCSLCAQG